MDAKPQTTGQVREVLRELAAQRPVSAEELAHMERGCLLLRLHIQSNSLGTNMPEVAWHFLSDPDIRYKSSDYRDTQTAELLFALDRWEQEEIA